jgi:hypothetical protein
MSPPTEWGPPVWTLFHTFAEKINPNKFSELAPQFFFYIKRICSSLPCPDCSQHATTFLARVNFNGIKNKEDLQNLLYIFHNVVNRRKNKPLFNREQVTNVYANKNTINVYNNFISVYQTKGNLKLLADSFQRRLILQDFKKWVIANIRSFV